MHGVWYAGTARRPGGLRDPVSQQCRISFAARDPALDSCRSRSISVAAQQAEAEAAQHVQLDLPQYCPGCGIQLQIQDAGAARVCGSSWVPLAGCPQQFSDAVLCRYARLPRTFEKDLDLFQDVEEVVGTGTHGVAMCVDC